VSVHHIYCHCCCCQLIHLHAYSQVS
jgi:hypothetical protein